MDTIKQAYLTGERALFHASDVQVEDSTFAQGESPLKESHNIRLHNSIFKWKYPLWYSTNIECCHTTLMETARSGIWYSEHVTMKDCVLQAPKTSPLMNSPYPVTMHLTAQSMWSFIMQRCYPRMPSGIVKM